ncbi:hypothetical protein H0R92_13780 [Treponema sp. OMZ 840]|uniref:LysM peptidoglycan-binding domain-containing protein n=1 Tax=Treponema sp. OMZ 840 TaxID=244313 RepID=UPI003D94D76B
MKKNVLIVLCLLGIFVCALSAASYIDNPYQKLAREYKAKSEKAFDAGDYDKAVEYSLLAEENAELSEAYVAEMLAKYEANTRIIYARNRVLYAKNLKADVNYPMAFAAGQKALDNAVLAYGMENWATATLYAEECLTALQGIKEILPLPKYYIVTPWAKSKDCYWNISAKPYVYNNPLLWENLYQANKSSMPDPSNADLIHPGMKITIPSLNGEFRDGVYSPSVKYDVYGAQKTGTENSPGIYGQQTPKP